MFLYAKRKGGPPISAHIKHRTVLLIRTEIPFTDRKRKWGLSNTAVETRFSDGVDYNLASTFCSVYCKNVLLLILLVIFSNSCNMSVLFIYKKCQTKPQSARALVFSKDHKGPTLQVKKNQCFLFC